MPRLPESLEPRFSVGERVQIGIFLAAAIPFAAVRFFGFRLPSPIWTALALGLAIVGAAYFLAWATESLQTVVSQAFALAVLALIQVLPEYSFEMVLAWEQKLQYAAATMTGANRLLLGIGWPLVFFIAFFSARRRGKAFKYITLSDHQAVEVTFLLIAAAYSLVIVLKASLSVWDGLVLVGVYAAYVLVALRLPPAKREGEAAEPGPGGKIARFKGVRKVFWVTWLLAFGAVIILFGAEPFISSLEHVAETLGISKYLFLQYFAPFLSEFPESITAFVWAGTVALASMGLANLVSSKLNQWTLLIATIPVTYSLSIGHIAAIPLDTQQVHEILLTAAQTVYGVAFLLDLKFQLRNALILLLLFLIQFFLPEARVPVAVMYFVLAGIELWQQRHDLQVFRAFAAAIRDPVARAAPQPQGQE
ncbi:MAG: sodium:calcium antiporter [Symbiobacteriia bacterium]